MRRNLLIGTIALSALLFFMVRLKLYSGSCGQFRLTDFRCSELLGFSEAMDFVKNDPTLNKVKRSNPQSYIQVSVNEKSNCPGKGMIIIAHSSSKDCDSLNRILKEG
ncbi:MAG: hypothetical protein LH702_06875, partial [Phormidesmis sp. CAN_BIN44]|nr:hypothetical protein [Phormidesmis sp. CAN_BIN44]